jgi:hypothetical protein
MSRQPTRRSRGLALAVTVAALVALVGAGQALATQAGVPDEPAVVPDERVLERQGRIDRQAAAQQAAEQGRAEPFQGASAAAPGWRLRPEPLPMAPPPQFGDRQVAPAPTAAAPAGGWGGPAVMVVVAVLLAVGAATTWRVRHRRPQPESTA